MNLYTFNKICLSQLKEKPFKLEKEIQNIFENNLQDIMGLQLVKSEFAIKNKRIEKFYSSDIFFVSFGVCFSAKHFPIGGECC